MSDVAKALRDIQRNGGGVSEFADIISTFFNREDLFELVRQSQLKFFEKKSGPLAERFIFNKGRREFLGELNSKIDRSDRVYRSKVIADLSPSKEPALMDVIVEIIYAEQDAEQGLDRSNYLQSLRKELCVEAAIFFIANAIEISREEYYIGFEEGKNYDPYYGNDLHIILYYRETEEEKDHRLNKIKIRSKKAAEKKRKEQKEAEEEKRKRLQELQLDVEILKAELGIEPKKPGVKPQSEAVAKARAKASKKSAKKHPVPKKRAKKIAGT